MASPVAKAATLVSLALLVLVLGLAASTASAERGGSHRQDGWDFAWGEEEADDAWGGWERRWGRGSAPGKGAFEHSASATGDGKSFSFSWSSDDTEGVHGGASYAGNWKPQQEEETGGAKAEK